MRRFRSHEVILVMRGDLLTEDYQIEFADLHQLLPVQSDLFHVNGDREDGVGATADTRTGDGQHRRNKTHKHRRSEGGGVNLE